MGLILPQWSSYKLVTAPAEEPVTIEDARRQCALGDSMDFDPELRLYTASARERVETVTARKLITQTWDVFYDGFPYCFVLPFGNLQSVDQFAYTDSNATTTSLTVSGNSILSGSVTIAHVETEDGSLSSTGRIVPAYAQQWPTVTLKTSRPVRIRVTVGWPRASVRPALLQATRLLIGEWFRNREVTKDTPVFALPEGFLSLVSDHIVYA